MTCSDPIGIFDSGIGGLTVYRALRAALPHENFIYLGDTARLPYGTKSRETVENYTLNAAHALRHYDIKCLVVACNTASAYGLAALRHALPDLPVCGVIAPGAAATVAATRNNHIAVLATEGTVRSGIYRDSISALQPEAELQMLACNLLVALAEEGWRDGIEAETIIARYLAMLQPGYDTLVLGCTHYPLLLPVFGKLCGPDIRIVDSATATAKKVLSLLTETNNLNPQSIPGTDQFLVTDLPERFARLGEMFLGRPILDKVTLTMM